MKIKIVSWVPAVFLLTPLLGAVIGGVAFSIFSLLYQLYSSFFLGNAIVWPAIYGQALVFSVVSLIFSYPSMLIIALPFFLYFERRNVQSGFYYTLSGAIGGCVAVAICVGLMMLGRSDLDNSWGILFAIGFGVLYGASNGYAGSILLKRFRPIH